jgi:Cu/Ag efflux pump CusA
MTLMHNSESSHQMRGFFGTILHFRFLVVVLAAAVMVFGIIQLRHMPVDVLPEVAPPHVEIQTEALGLSSEEMENLITVPLEHNLLNGVPWIDRIHSDSVSGLSSVKLTFEPGTDLYRARQMVAERLAQGAPTLPRVSRGPVMLQPTSASSRVLVVRLSSKKLSAIQMSVLARWTITPRLMGVPGVANVAVWGMRDRQLQVQVDPDRLRAYQIPLLQVLESVGNALWVSPLSFVEAATPGNAGFIDTPQQRMGIQHISPIVSPESLSQVSVQAPLTLLVNQSEKNKSAKPTWGGAVRVSDVADVVENHQPLIGDALSNDGNSLLLVIEKFPGTDTVKVTQGVEAALRTMQPGLGGMEIDSTVFRPATFIEMARQNLTRAALIGCLIVALMIGFYFRNWRAALVSIVTIPLALVAAGVVLHLCGATLNVMSLTGLVVAAGVVVGDAILVIDNILRRLQKSRPSSDPGEQPQSLASVIVQSMREMQGVLLFSALVCLLAVLPVFSLQATDGALFQPLAIAYVLAVLASTLVAFVVTPALSAILLSGVADAPTLPRVRRLQISENGLLSRIISRPSTAYLVIAVLAGVGLGLLTFIRPALLPTFKERDLLIHFQTAPGMSHPEMVRLVNRVTGELRTISGVRNVSTLVGRAVYGDRTVGVNSAEVFVNLAPTANYEATIAAIRVALDGYAGIRSEVQTYLKQISSGLTAEASAPMVVRLYGQDWTILKTKAEELRQGLSGIAGVSDLTISHPMEEPTLEVEVDIAAAQRHGINPGSVRRAASTLVNGIQVGSLFEEQKVFDVVVWSTPKTRNNLAAIHDLLIDTPFEVPVRLGDVAQARLVPRPSLIKHEDVSRYVDIGVNVTGRNARAVMADIQTRLGQFQFPLEYHAKVFDNREQQRASRYRFVAFAAIAIIGILLLLHAAYDNWRLAILSLLTVPLALVGGLIALIVAAHSISLGAVFGLLTVFGIAARDQLMLIRRFRQLHGKQASSSGAELVLEGMRGRFAPILITALTIGLALLPLLFMGDIPGFEILRPTALVILCGMVTAALVDLFVVPALCLRLVRPDFPPEK